MTQIFMIHGGETFKSEEDYLNYLKTRNISIEEYSSWAVNLKKELENEFQIIKPMFPLKENARYIDWKIYFERFFPYLKDDIILIGNSLGSIFLTRYLSENKFPKKIHSIYLVCAAYDNTLPNYDLVRGFELGNDLSLIETQCNDINFMFSEDDDIVPIEHAKKYKEKLPNAKYIIYDNKNGHFKVEKFPELIEMIKKSTKNL